MNCYNQSPFPRVKQSYITAFASIMCNKSSCGVKRFQWGWTGEEQLLSYYRNISPSSRQNILTHFKIRIVFTYIQGHTVSVYGGTEGWGGGGGFSSSSRALNPGPLPREETRLNRSFVLFCLGISCVSPNCGLWTQSQTHRLAGAG